MRHSVLVAIEHNVAFVFDEDTFSEGSVERAHGVGGVITIIIAEDLRDSFCYGGDRIERDAREEMMRDVIV